MREETGVPAKKTKKKRRWIWIVAAVLIVAVLAMMRLGSRQTETERTEGGTYTEQEITRQTIRQEVTGSGTLEAANSYSVTSLVEATILSADFEEGDHVEQDDVLYTIDASDVSGNLEQAQLSVSQSRRNYERTLENRDKLSVQTKAAGRITSLDVEIGDDVTAGQIIATVQDTDVMSLEVPFPADDAEAFTVGQAATVTMDSTFETIPGRISKIAAIDTVLTGNRIVRTVTIEVANPGGLTTTQTATAAVGGAESTAGGTFSFGDEAKVTAEISGTVSALNFAEGDRVNKNAVLAVLTSKDLGDQIDAAKESLRNAEISLENRYDQLDNYTITSPISGTIIDKNYKAGENTEMNKVLCTIYDLSYLTMTLSVDELDITDIDAGQTVQITADAVEGKTYEGVVTKVGVVGTSTNGVATYPVTIRIDETEGLLPGMTVDAAIVLAERENVLTVPAEALIRGNRVMVTAASPSASNGEPVENETGETKYYTVEVQIGASDDDNIEILSGLQDGDVIAYTERTRGESSIFPMMGGMNRGNYGDGMNRGGMGGGRPGGT